jgi:hypothetical protein
MSGETLVFVIFTVWFVFCILLVMCLCSENKHVNKVVSILTFQKAFKLTDYQGDVYFTRSRTNLAYVYPITNVGSIILQSDGTVTRPNGRSCYIETWEKY